MSEKIGDVLTLESIDEQWAIFDLNKIIDRAINFDLPYNRKFSFGDRMNVIKYLKSLWQGESWERIKMKLGTEGSVWYVWWMGGVRQHLQNLRNQNGQ